ncbi:hypothetical protein RF11_12474 [Thelohanellus kitauei]|uniref:ribonuclease Z n=1 Tax=Thelohanellus kitauei TaxID=669202 RepID=A0A0C2N9P6_THEKT|nr:hypothetical protein RF11_12474 [Thelohanellus kitauei]
MLKTNSFEKIVNFHPLITTKYFIKTRKSWTKSAHTERLTLLIFEFAKISGKLNVEKARDLGVETLQFSTLKNGEAIMTAKQLFEIYDSPFVVFIDCSSESLLDELASQHFEHEPIQKYFYAVNYLMLRFSEAHHYVINSQSFKITPSSLFSSFSKIYRQLSDKCPTLFHPLTKAENKTENLPDHVLNCDEIDLKAHTIETKQPELVDEKETDIWTPKNYPSCLFLGTDAFNSDNEAVILDCGESTLSQLYFKTDNQIETHLKKIAFIYITHIHADHHLVITEMQDNYSLPGSDIKVTLIPVDHSVEAYAIRMETHGKSLVYSGDTRPCQLLIEKEVFKPAPVHFCTDFTSTASATVSTYGRVVLRLGTFLQAVKVVQDSHLLNTHPYPQPTRATLPDRHSIAGKLISMNQCNCNTVNSG